LSPDSVFESDARLKRGRASYPTSHRFSENFGYNSMHFLAKSRCDKKIWIAGTLESKCRTGELENGAAFLFVWMRVGCASGIDLETRF